MDRSELCLVPCFLCRIRLAAVFKSVANTYIRCCGGVERGLTY